MSGSATLKGEDQVLRAIEERLGDPKVKKVAYKILREEAKEQTEDLRAVIGTFPLSGRNTAAVDHGGVIMSSGTPTIKIGFGDPSRAPLVHLSEFGYAGNGSPRGLGAIRKLAEANKPKYLQSVQAKIKQELL